jgi:hypothetical protein
MFVPDSNLAIHLSLSDMRSCLIPSQFGKNNAYTTKARKARNDHTKKLSKTSEA